MKTVAVVIPVYKKQLSAYEKISLQQCCKVLCNYNIILAKPYSLNIDEYTVYNENFGIENFEDAYFANIKGYNQLMLTPHFYERFLKYDFILIYQLDAFVFKDDLQYWCNSSYDYIGAPWLEEYKTLYRHVKLTIRKMWHYKLDKKIAGSNVPTRRQFYNAVGNGGFSLRRVEKFYKLAQQEQTLINYYLANSHNHHFNEDAFWAMEVNRKHRRLRIPSYKKALHFSIENLPEYAMQLNKQILPFGCHAWDLCIPFWKPIFRQLGYDI